MFWRLNIDFSTNSCMCSDVFCSLNFWSLYSTSQCHLWCGITWFHIKGFLFLPKCLFIESYNITWRDLVRVFHETTRENYLLQSLQRSFYRLRTRLQKKIEPTASIHKKTLIYLWFTEFCIQKPKFIFAV